MIICTFKFDDKPILYFSFCPNTITFLRGKVTKCSIALGFFIPHWGLHDAHSPSFKAIEPLVTFPRQIKSKQYRLINSCELDPNVVLTKEIQKVKLIESIASKHSAKRKT